MIEPGISLAVAALLFASLIYLLLREKSERKRLAAEIDLPLENRVPRHYKRLGSVEEQLWRAEQSQCPTNWDSATLNLRERELTVVAEYLTGLREDFRRGNRIFRTIILHSPDFQILRALEWQRFKLNFAFLIFSVFISIRLRLKVVSVKELARLTDIVATLAYFVRSMLNAIEREGQREAVESFIRRS